MLEPLLLVHVAATWFMVGLIWFVQIVHYPMFDDVGEARFSDYCRRHQRLTTRVVGPVMLAELTCAVAVAFLGWNSETRAWAIAGLVVLATIWCSTALVQVPHHRALERGYEAPVHRTLVRFNWIRAWLWTARGAIALVLLWIKRDARWA